MQTHDAIRRYEQTKKDDEETYGQKNHQDQGYRQKNKKMTPSWYELESKYQMFVFEVRFLASLLKKHNGNVASAAREIKICARRLRRITKRLGIDAKSFKK